MTRKSRRVLGVIGAVVGTTVLFVSAVAAGAIVHLDTKATRRLVATRVDESLSGTFAGSIAIERIGHLGLGGVDGVRVRVRDADGVQVLFADGIRVRLRTIDLARSAFLERSGPIRVGFGDVAIDHVDASLDPDPSGRSMRIANAFGAAKREQPPNEEAPGRGVRVEAPSVMLRHAWVHGAPPGAPTVDADVSGLRGGAHVDEHGTRADLEEVSLVTRGLPRGADPRGTITAHVDLGERRVVEASFEGVLAEIPTHASARMDGKHVDARLDVTRATGEKLGALIGTGLVKGAGAELHAEAHGDLPRVDAVAQLRAGRGEVSLEGTVETGEATRVRAKLAARAIDLGTIFEGAPSSDLGLDARGKVTIGPGGDVKGDLAFDTLAGTLAGAAVPRAQLRGAFTKDSAWGGLRIHHPDMPTDIAVAMLPVDGERVVDAEAKVSVAELARLPIVGAYVRGAARAKAEGRVNLTSKALTLHMEVDAAGLEREDQRVEVVSVSASASGTLDAPVVNARLHAGLVRLGSLGVFDGVEASARIEQRGAIIVHDPRVDVVRGGERVHASADNIEVDGARIGVRGASVQGLGEPIAADFDKRGADLRVAAHAPRIDLAKVAAFAGRRDVRAGSLSLDADLRTTRSELGGEVHAAVRDLAASRVEGGTLRFDATFAERDVTLAIAAALADVGHLSLRTDAFVLGGAATRVGSWRDATGRVEIDGDVSLRKLAALVPEDVLPVSEVGGELVLRGAAWRRHVDAPPRMHVTAYTRGLVVAGKTAPEPAIGGTRVKGVAPWRSQDFDVELDARLDAAADDNELNLRIHDRKGIVAALDVKARLPVVDFAKDPAQARRALESAPISAKLVVPRRPLSTMPSLVGVKNVAGAFEAEADLTGTLLDPRVTLRARGLGIRAGWLPVRLATDSDVRFTYDGKVAELGAKVSAEDHEVLALGSRVDVRIEELVHGRTPDWTAGARVKLERFPLEAVNALADRRVRGLASGEVTLEGLHRDAAVRGTLALERLSIGGAQYTKGQVDLDAKDGRLEAGVKLDQRDGSVDLRLSAGIGWGAAPVPAVDPSAQVEGKLVAKSFRIAALAPFVQGPLNGLDGRLDANASVAIGPDARRWDGRIVLREGKVQITALGEELRDLRANLTLKQDGTVMIDDVFARGTEGELRADAIVRTEGLALASADANVHIPSKEALDFALEGQPVGRLAGDAKIHAKASDDGSRIDVRIDVPKLRAELPQSMKSGVQELAESKEIRVGVYRSPGELVRLPLDKEDLEEQKGTSDREPSTVFDLDVRLGEVTVVRGNQVRVVLHGNPRVTIGEETRVSGQIQLDSGRIEVQGKEFEVERGTVTFQPDDKSNPIVVATASWTAGDGTKVYADFVGPLKTGKVNLRSEPARPKNEILALILFGTAEGMNAAPPPPGRAPDGTTKAAVGIGGGFAAQGLTEALDDLAGIQATARIDTTSSSNPRPEVEIQIAKNIAVEFGHVLGTPPITEPDKNLVTFDWRFMRSWSLETTFGDRGRATFDAVWQKRY